MKTSWIDGVQQDAVKVGFAIKERLDGSVSMLIIRDRKFVIRVFERPDDTNFKYTADIAVARNFDRWANSTDWFACAVEPFSLCSLLRVVSEFHRKHYYDKDYSDYLDISRQVINEQESMKERYCLECLPNKVVMVRKGFTYTCPLCKTGYSNKA